MSSSSSSSSSGVPSSPGSSGDEHAPDEGKEENGAIMNGGEQVNAGDEEVAPTPAPAPLTTDDEQPAAEGATTAGAEPSATPAEALQEQPSPQMDDYDSDIGAKINAGGGRRAAGSGSGSEGGEEGKSPAQAKLTEEDLFGDAGDLSSSDDETTTKKREESEAKEPEIIGPRLYFDEDEEDQDAAEPQESLIEVDAPRINVDLGQGLHFVKFPNFLSVEPRPFDPETYEDEIDDEDIMDEEGRSRLKLKVENTIRWRNVTDAEGNVRKESNAKFVQWSDGSLSLYLGSEIFDVHPQKTAGDHNHLFIRQGSGLQGQAVFRTKLSFRPHSTDTLTHRKMTLSMADRSSKAQKVKVLAAVGTDPEAQKQEMIRKEEERLRASARRESQQRRLREKALSRGGRALSPHYLEGEDSDDPDSLSAVRKSYRPGGREYMRGLRDRGESAGRSAGYDSEESDEGSRRLQQAKALESDDDEEGTSKKSGEPAKKKSKKIISDSEEDD